MRFLFLVTIFSVPLISQTQRFSMSDIRVVDAGASAADPNTENMIIVTQGKQGLHTCTQTLLNDD